MAAWPAVPYAPIRDSWKRAPFLPPIRTEMEGGNVRMRRRPGDNVAIISQVVEMTESELSTLDAWVVSDIGSGVGRFTMSVWLGSAFQSKTAQFEAGSGDFPYAVSAVTDGVVRVTMALRVFDA